MEVVMQTMEWTRQSEEMFKTWTEAQTRMWNEWLKAMQGFGKSPSSQVWDKTIEAWEESIKKILDAQVDWTQRWTESFATNQGTPKEMAEWAKQGQDMCKRWTDTQKQLWTGWFQVVKKLDPTGTGVNWSGEGQSFVRGWQEAVEKGLNSQAEWLRVWSEGPGAQRPKGKTGG
jgi:hypothetical protein